MKPADYEQLVSRIAADLVKAVEGLAPDRVAYGLTNCIAGKSGYADQIDVSVAVPSTLLLIECKYWSRKVRAEATLAFIARVLDIRDAQAPKQVLGALVSRKGFQPGSEALARHFGIDLHTVRSPTEFALGYKGRLHIGVTEVAALAELGSLTVHITDSDDAGLSDGAA